MCGTPRRQGFYLPWVGGHGEYIDTSSFLLLYSIVLYNGLQPNSDASCYWKGEIHEKTATRISFVTNRGVNNGSLFFTWLFGNNTLCPFPWPGTENPTSPGARLTESGCLPVPSILPAMTSNHRWQPPLEPLNPSP